MIISVLILSTIVFLGLAFYYSRINASFLPSGKSLSAHLFSRSTVSTSISLATIIIAYLNLAAPLGILLFWTALMGGGSLLVLYYFADRIQNKLEESPNVSTLNGYLADQYSGSQYLKAFVSIASLIGILLILSTEVIVSARFIGALIGFDQIFILALIIAVVPVAYVLISGFQGVIKTDSIQMIVIWVMIVGMLVGICFLSGNSKETLKSCLSEFWSELSFNSQSIGFLIAIAFLNLPNQLCSFAAWQRIKVIESREALRKGSLHGAATLLLSWGLLVLIALLLSKTTKAGDGASIISSFIEQMQVSFIGHLVAIVLIVGLFSAMISTASTLIIAAAEIVGRDLTAKITMNPNKNRALTALMVVAVILAVFLLEHFDWSVESLVFSIYGGVLSLTGVIVFSFYLPENRRARLKRPAEVSVTLGFLSSWGVALYGKSIGDGNLIFQAPTVGIIVGALVMGAGVLLTRGSRGEGAC